MTSTSFVLFVTLNSFQMELEERSTEPFETGNFLLATPVERIILHIFFFLYKEFVNQPNNANARFMPTRK